MSISLIKENDPKIKRKKLGEFRLKDHQRRAVYIMQQRENDGFITQSGPGVNYQLQTKLGILADEPGVGKTLMVLSLIKLQKKEQVTKKTEKVFMHSEEVYNLSCEVQLSNQIPVSLIVVRSNLREQWEQEIKKTGLTYYICNRRKDGLTSLTKQQLLQYDILLCPSYTFNLVVEQYPDVIWKRVVFDEADTIRIPKSREPNALFYWIVTATPENFPNFNQLGFLRKLVRGIQSHQIALNLSIVKNDPNTIKMADVQEEYVECQTPMEITLLHGHISQNAIEMLNAGDISGAIREMGGKEENQDTVIQLATEKLKQELDNIWIEFQMIKQQTLPDKIKNQRILSIASKWESKYDRKKSIEQKLKKIQDENCSICYSPLENPTKIDCDCHQLFCRDCITEWIKQNPVCPLCRTHKNLGSLVIINNNVVNTKKRNRNLLSKNDNVLKLINETPNGRFLIFSNHHFTQLANFLTSKGIKYETLRGLPSKYSSTFYRLRSGQIKAILLNAQNAGTGHNMEMATDVILYHELPNHTRKQVIGRALRLNRKEALRVWYLKYSNEYTL